MERRENRRKTAYPADCQQQRLRVEAGAAVQPCGDEVYRAYPGIFVKKAVNLFINVDYFLYQIY